MLNLIIDECYRDRDFSQQALATKRSPFRSHNPEAQRHRSQAASIRVEVDSMPGRGWTFSVSEFRRRVRQSRTSLPKWTPSCQLGPSGKPGP